MKYEINTGSQEPAEFDGLGLIVVTVDENIGRETFERYFRGGNGFEGLPKTLVEKQRFNTSFYYMSWSVEDFPLLETLTIDPGVLVEPWYLSSEELWNIKQACNELKSKGNEVEDIAPAPLWLLAQMQKQILGVPFVVAGSSEESSEENLINNQEENQK